MVLNKYGVNRGCCFVAGCPPLGLSRRISGCAPGLFSSFVSIARPASWGQWCAWLPFAKELGLSPGLKVTPLALLPCGGCCPGLRQHRTKVRCEHQSGWDRSWWEQQDHHKAIQSCERASNPDPHATEVAGSPSFPKWN